MKKNIIVIYNYKILVIRVSILNIFSIVSRIFFLILGQ